jgi:hypothetical protein
MIQSIESILHVVNGVVDEADYVKKTKNHLERNRAVKRLDENVSSSNSKTGIVVTLEARMDDYNEIPFSRIDGGEGFDWDDAVVKPSSGDEWIVFMQKALVLKE